MKDGKTVAIVPGSFDPITYGHIDIAKRAAQLYDTVYLAVMINDQKKYIFTFSHTDDFAVRLVCHACSFCGRLGRRNRVAILQKGETLFCQLGGNGQQIIMRTM